MGDRRPMRPFTSGDYDFPPATSSNNDVPSTVPVTIRLERLRRELQVTREQTRARNEDERYANFRNRLSARIGRRYRDSGNSSSVPDTPQSRSLDADDVDEGRRRGAKRRKIHHSVPQPSFQYGHYGQVEAGRLRLDLESCDGDIHDDRGRIYYGPENILKHDKSVYCTRSSRCNIILRHHDSSPFTLDRLYILAPENGFTAPLKEGLIYVAMSREDLLPHLRNADQQANYLAPPRSPPNTDRDNVRLSLLESLQDPDVGRALRQHRNREWSPFDSSADQNSSPEIEDTDDPWGMSRDTVWPPLEPRSSSRRPAHQVSDLTGCDEQTHPISDDDMQIVVLTDDEINLPEDPTTAAVLADRERRERSMAVDDDDMYGWDSRYRTAHTRLRQRSFFPQRKERGETLPSPQFDQARNDGVTRARFQIKDGKHKVAIKFDPPVSGTHILLKLQTPFMGKNIDVQTVIASGYAGPRFFPAVSMR